MSREDELYRLPLDEFTAARNALAKSIGGGEGRRIKALQKPTVVPWAINQLYWRDRSTYDRVMKSGDALRTAQIAALKGRAADVRRASDGHRAAVAHAVHVATELAAQHGSHPSADQLARMLEALSLSPAPPEPAGRLTTLVQPSGFEALAGVSIRGGHTEPPAGGGHHPAHQEPPSHGGRRHGRGTGAEPSVQGGGHRTGVESPSPGAGHEPRTAAIERREAAARRRDAERQKRQDAKRQREEAARQKRHEADVRHAEQHVKRLRERDSRARAAADTARRELEAAEQALARLRNGA